MDAYDDDNANDPFALSDPWKPSKFMFEARSPIIRDLQELDCQKQSVEPLDISIGVKLVFPDLDSFNYGPLDATTPTDSSSISLHEKDTGDDQVAEDSDFWLVAGTEEISEVYSLQTWERFYDRTYQEPLIYLSEAGPRVFDAVLLDIPTLIDSSEVDSHEQAIIHVDPLLPALFQLGTGRQSALFAYDDIKRSFVPRLDNVRPSGYSFTVYASLISKFNDYGMQTLQLRSFVEDIYSQSSPSALKVAAAATISSISSILLDLLYRRSLRVRSLLQLQSAYERPAQLLNYLCAIVSAVSEACNDEEVLCSVFNLTMSLEFSELWFRPVALQILSHISKPWLDSIGGSIGLAESSLSANGYSEDQTSEGGLHDKLQSQTMPRFMTPQDRENILEARHALRLLRLHAPSHLLCGHSKTSLVEVPELEWLYDWTDIQRIDAKAGKYEARIQHVLYSNEGSGIFQDHMYLNDKETPSASIYEFDLFEDSRQKLESDALNLSAEVAEEPNQTRYGSSSKLHKAVEEALSDETGNLQRWEDFAPPLSVAPILSFSSVISVQKRLLNEACLQVLFKAGLRKHLQVQRRFHLLNDGVFASRLAHALFDPELGSAERRKGHRRGGVLGLKLGARESWPPASSELRLALAGILFESYSSTSEAEKIETLGNDLPGGLSFAIRDISEEEIQKCMDPNSIEALDFLRLQYKAPAPLDAILTVQCMDKYDAVFKLLLRVTRMLFVVNQLSLRSRNRSRSFVVSKVFETRFQFEAHVFVSAVAEYFSHSISSIWNQFEGELLTVESCLETPGSESRLSPHEGINLLRERHEQTLDNILFALLLRKRQEKAMRLLEKAFGSILAFAKPDTTGSRVADAETPSSDRLYHDFHGNVRNFIEICKALSEKPIHGKNAMKSRLLSNSPPKLDHTLQGEPSILTQLVLRLEMNLYYVRTSGAG
jgi:hypothetical protein